jgi:hypothetical protein
MSYRWKYEHGRKLRESFGGTDGKGLLLGDPHRFGRILVFLSLTVALK